MRITHRHTFAGALVGALALGAGLSSAGAQDTSRAGQTGPTSETPKMPGQGGAMDTAGYSGIERPKESPNTYKSGADSSRTGQDTSRARTGRDTSAQTGQAERIPKMPGQGGAADTAGYTASKQTMGGPSPDSSSVRSRTGASSDTATTRATTKTKARKHKRHHNPVRQDTTATGAGGRTSSDSTHP